VVGEAEDRAVHGFIEERELYNPPDRYLLIMIWIPFTVCLIGGIWFLLDSRPTSFFIMLIVGIIVVSVDYYREYIVKPRSVSIRHDGIVLHFRLRQDRYCSWEDIEGIYSKPGPEWTRWGKGVGKGGIKLESDHSFHMVSYFISQAVISRYTRTIGRPPYTWGGW